MKLMQITLFNNEIWYYIENNRANESNKYTDIPALLKQYTNRRLSFWNGYKWIGTCQTLCEFESVDELEEFLV